MRNRTEVDASKRERTSLVAHTKMAFEVNTPLRSRMRSLSVVCGVFGAGLVAVLGAVAGISAVAHTDPVTLARAVPEIITGGSVLGGVGILGGASTYSEAWSAAERREVRGHASTRLRRIATGATPAAVIVIAAACVSGFTSLGTTAATDVLSFAAASLAGIAAGTEVVGKIAAHGLTATELQS